MGISARRLQLVSVMSRQKAEILPLLQIIQFVHQCIKVNGPRRVEVILIVECFK